MVGLALLGLYGGMRLLRRSPSPLLLSAAIGVYASLLVKEWFPGYEEAFFDGIFCILERDSREGMHEVAREAPFEGEMWRPVFAVAEVSTPNTIVLGPPSG